jgi:hypothetical protein
MIHRHYLLLRTGRRGPLRLGRHIALLLLLSRHVHLLHLPLRHLLLLLLLLLLVLVLRQLHIARSRRHVRQHLTPGLERRASTDVRGKLTDDG